MQFTFISFFKIELPQRENTQLSSGLCNNLILPIPSVLAFPFLCSGLGPHYFIISSPSTFFFSFAEDS